MAITFELWAQCSDSIEREAFARHFAGVENTLLSGRRVTWRADPQPGDAPAISIWSPDLPNRGVRTVTHAVELTEAGLRLYSHLRSAPEFLFARAAREAICIPLEELPDYLIPHSSGVRLTIECAMRADIFEKLGRPAFCYPFREGYLWTRYRGESYSPLGSIDQPELDALRKALFPEHA